jgi:hypothetical protein
MWCISFASRMWHNMRPGGTTREKWRIPDRKVGEMSVFMIEAPKVVAHAFVDQGPCRLGPYDQALIMYKRIWDLWGSANLLASTVAELDDTPPYLQGV